MFAGAEFDRAAYARAELIAFEALRSFEITPPTLTVHPTPNTCGDRIPPPGLATRFLIRALVGNLKSYGMKPATLPCQVRLSLGLRSSPTMAATTAAT